MAEPRALRRAFAAVGLVLVALVTPVDPAPVAARAPLAARRGALLTELRTMTGGTARIATGGIDGSATFIGGSVRQPLAPPDDSAPEDVARAFVEEYAPAFGVESPSEDLVEDRTVEGLAGGTAVRFRQEHRGVPVLAGEIAVQVAADGRVLSSSGEAVPSLDLDTDPAIDADAAAGVAVALTARDHDVDASRLAASQPELMVYAPELIGAPSQLGPRLVWQVDVRTSLGDVDDFVLVDAERGSIALRFNQREDAASVAVCDNAEVPRPSFSSATCTAPVRTAGSGPSAVADVEAAYQLSLATYDYLFQQFGRDSVDDHGMQLRSTVRFCLQPGPCTFENAFWNGSQMVYGPGYASADDVVAHELTHGMTQYTAELLYFGEAGAINESVSDVFGELMDLQHGADPPSDRWKMGEDIPRGAVRDMADPTLFGHPDRAGSPLYVSSTRDGGGVHINSGISNKAASLMTDGGSFNGQTLTGIGPVKTGRIYYQALTTLLSPGSDLEDLYDILQQACANLIGTGGITAGDCDEVRKAVTATEMDLAAPTGGVRVSAPMCPDGAAVVTTSFADDFETVPNTNWLTSRSSGGVDSWATVVGASESGTRSMWAANSQSSGWTEVHTAASTVIPTVGSTFLRFDHWYSLEYTERSDLTLNQYWDGGVVGVSTTGPSGTYVDVATLGPGSAVNTYPHTLQSGGSNPLRGRPAFSGVTTTYQTSRYDLTSFAGKAVNVQFLLGSDAGGGAEGWFVDDVSIYTCVAAPTGPPGPPGPGPGYVPVGPERVLDTRPGNSAGALLALQKTPLRPGADLTVPVTGLGSGAITPATGVGAVSLNVAVTNPTAAGFVTVYPCADRKLVASVNFAAGQTVSNAVIAPVSGAGTICVHSLVPTDLIVDINGWFPAGPAFTAVGPERVFDTRGASPNALVAVPRAQVSPQQDLRVQVAGLGGGAVTPVSGLGAVSLNVAVTNPAAAGYVTVYPCADRTLVASVNFPAGATLSNAVIAPVSPQGAVCFASYVATDLVVDVNGWFPTGSAFRAVGPHRVFDTRGESPSALVGVPDAQVSPTNELTVVVAGLGSGATTPATGVGAVSLNVAVTNPLADGFVTVYPCADRELVASVNYVAGQTVSNAVIAPVSPAGTICFYSLVPTDLVVDINGWLPAG